jgi:hypothetical protein
LLGLQPTTAIGIDALPPGALRVRVYRGMDPIAKRQMYLTEVVRPGPKAGDQAEKYPCGHSRREAKVQLHVRQRRLPNAAINPETGLPAATPLADITA